ncbi:MAG: hypothetical protein KGY48_05360 [Wenzhouxiangellaceae bacterium]|nr:hypothetical protein [Wenzhouxiangellaceae bacterium]MBS3746307.1 hypothetical protein [Wenzhouxiangellaceae bacterium]MBS3823098.1 hypothetical protein [Wenzhouxiangellaceae bacterium]
MLFRNFLIIALLAGSAVSARAQLGELNFLTDLNTPFPPGCLSIDLPEQPRSAESLVLDQTIAAPTINSDTRDGSVLVQAWRVACAGDEFSVMLVRMRQVGGDLPIVVPEVFADSGDVDFPLHKAQLQLLPGSGNVGASGDIITTAGTTWMLAVDPVPLQEGDALFLPEDYNETFSLEFNWGSYAPAEPEGTVFLIDRFEPSLDPPQFDEPVLNGRYSGQWVREGAANQGLVLQIAEQVDENFVFAIFFTYLDGEPVWVTGNSTAGVPEPGPVTVPMFTLENGAFITDGNQPSADQVPPTDAGSIEIEVIDCNRLQVNYDFTPLGKGTGSIELDRFIRIAGYDCNPWD